MTEFTREYFVNRRNKVIDKYMDDHAKAPVRRGYSKLAGMPIPSQADITRAAQAQLRVINDTCTTLGFDPIWNDEEEDKGLTGNPA